MAAPITAQLAYDLEFFTDFARLYPIRPERDDIYSSDPARAENFAFQQSAPQGAYLIMAIHAVGLDADSMGGINTDAADAEFLGGRNWKSNLLCNIGYGDLKGIRAHGSTATVSTRSATSSDGPAIRPDTKKARWEAGLF